MEHHFSGVIDHGVWNRLPADKCAWFFLHNLCVPFNSSNIAGHYCFPMRMPGIDFSNRCKMLHEQWKVFQLAPECIYFIFWFVYNQTSADVDVWSVRNALGLTQT